MGIIYKKPNVTTITMDGTVCEDKRHKTWTKFCNKKQFRDGIYSAMKVIGAGSHTAFSVHILDRSLLRGFFPKWHLGVANALLFNAHLGIGLYIYSRPCLSRASTSHRVLYSVYGSAIFNFGTVLLFGTGRNLLVDDRVIGSVYAICASLCFLCVGKYFFEFLDSQTRGMRGKDAEESLLESSS